MSRGYTPRHAQTVGDLSFAVIPQNPEEFSLRDIYSVLTDIRADQAKLRQDLQGVKKEMKKQMKDIKNDLIMEIAGVRVETVRVKDQDLKYSQLIADMTTSITTVERKTSIPTRDPFSPAVTVIAIGVRYEEHENVQVKAKALVHQGLELTSVNVVRAVCTPWRNNKPGIIQIELESVEEKIRILKEKKMLKTKQGFKKVFIRGGKSHEERLIQNNIQEVLPFYHKGSSTDLL